MERRKKKAKAMSGAVAPHPQCNEQMFQALKRHIMKERQKKKEEQEADAENERQRKEREAQEKQDVTTLSEIREQIVQLEQWLAQLKDTKHQLLLELKKVLNEDENRCQQMMEEQESRANTEITEIYNVPTPSHSHLLMQQEYPSSSYKVHPVQGSIKRPRSPSPPPPHQMVYRPYNPKTTRLPYKKSYTSSHYPRPGSSQTYYPAPPYTSLPIRSDAAQPRPMEQHYTSQSYMQHSGHPKMYPDGKYYSVASRLPTHVALHGGAIPIQPPQMKTGGITSSCPIIQPSTAPPQHVTPSISTTHSSPGYHYPMVSQYASRPNLAPSQHIAPHSHAVYPSHSSQSPTTGQLVYSQANVPQSRYM